MSLVPAAPAPRIVMSPDGLRLATYDFGDPDAPAVVAVHGFASGALLNWHASGWTRDLVRAGHRVVALDQRGHGASAKPHDPDAYSMDLLVADVTTVIDTYLLDDVAFVGYSLGARVGWHTADRLPDRITRAVLGGIPDADPMRRVAVDQAKAYIADGTPVEDRVTNGYLTMAAGVEGNDLRALVAMVEGMRNSVEPTPENAPAQPILLAAGSEDGIRDSAVRLAEAAPHASFSEIPGRNHFNAPTSRAFRDAAVAFLGPVG
ncbi:MULTISPECIES: alpha/beta fold hydrolase [unclassified Curtobacterium]|uniref:alpha/beta fold hydrolase n=1 Tax=unclassified Curtobacterium TaxID=257496 RepID=UPI0008DCFBDF|nr:MULTISPECIES: alpha/beta fold hydrolase [unclassified Curtobacterium]OIH97466.1 hydrolase [Curtobacterium sp. MCBA15_003]OII10211.1 hydrolase [Curtobacterium sp. MCBA15_009]OII29466.1 hydrolase [Curtobacterium sp. MMLR14_006]